MTTTDEPPILRLSTPGDLAGAVPYLLGFHPAESLVVVSLRGERHRVGLTARVDLPPREQEAAVVTHLVEALERDAADRALVMVYPRPGQPPPPACHRRLARRAVRALRDAGIDVLDAMCVTGGRSWSYICHDRHCCPPQGRPVRDDPRIGAAFAIAGRAPLADRATLEAAVGRADPAGRAAVTAALAVLPGSAGSREEALRAWERALGGEQPRRRRLEPAEAAALVVGLRDVLVRDAVIDIDGEDPARVEQSDPLLALLLELVAVAPEPDEAQVAASLAHVAWCRGEGALAGLAAERALARDPDHRLARLVMALLVHAIPPRRLGGRARG